MSKNVSIEEYFRLNVEKKLFVKAPRQEDDLDFAPATKLLEKRREMLEVESGLSQQKEEFAMKMESLAQRREELVKKEAQLKDSLSKFDKFLKENDAKRNRALKKSLEERKLKEQKEIESNSLKETYQQLIDKKEDQVKELETHMLYQKYLETVLENVNDFGEVKDLIARYDTLAATNYELLERAKQAQEQSEKEKTKFALFTEEKNNDILNYNNIIAKLQNQLEECQLKSAKRQSEVDEALGNATEKTLLLGQIKMATNNLFTLIRNHLNHRIANTNSTTLQLDKIEQFILDLSQIVNSPINE